LCNETHAHCDFLQAGDFQTLPMLDGGDVITRLKQGFSGTGVEPGHAAAEQLHLQLAAL